MITEYMLAKERPDYYREGRGIGKSLIRKLLA